MSFDRQSSATLAAAIPLADGVSNTRTGSVGVSARAAREDHVHPITRIANPPNPTPNVGGGSTNVTASTWVWDSTTEETATGHHIWTVSISGGSGWKNFSLSNPAGFTPEWQSSTAYRIAGGTFGPVPMLVLDNNNAWFWSAAGNETIVVVVYKQWRIT